MLLLTLFLLGTTAGDCSLKNFEKKSSRMLFGPGRKSTTYNVGYGTCARKCCEADWCDGFNFYARGRWSGDCVLMQVKSGQRLSPMNWMYSFYEKKSDTEEPAVDCWGQFESWGPCSKKCGGGSRSRKYSITTPAKNGGRDCIYRGTTLTQSCNTQKCPVPISCPTGWQLTFAGSADGECQQDPRNDGETRVSHATTVGACAEACEADSTCFAFDFKDGKCYKNVRCDKQDAGDGYLSCTQVVTTSSPTSLPTTMPTTSPTEMPSETPSEMPSKEPSMSPTEEPSMTPTYEPSLPPTEKPTPGLCNEDIRSELESLSCRSQVGWDSSLQNGRLNKMCMCVNEIDGANFMEDNTYDCKYNALDSYTIASVFSNCAEAVNSCSYWKNENDEFEYAEYTRGETDEIRSTLFWDRVNGCRNSFQNGGPRCHFDASSITCVDFPTACAQGDSTTCREIDEGCVYNHNRQVCMGFPTTCAEANAEGIRGRVDCSKIKNEDCYGIGIREKVECRKIPETCAQAEDYKGCQNYLFDSCIWT